ncbi:MAG: P-II family nitrogen regulator [Kiritimatiellia bacterium]|jgi:nitrogen regulatory protein PII
MELEAIICIVERGKAQDVVHKAVDAGAGGATIFYGRGAGETTFSFFHSLKIESSKEIIIIIVTSEKKAAVVEAMVEAARVEENGRGVLFTVPVNEIRGAML